jgi:hypothetical protein
VSRSTLKQIIEVSVDNRKLIEGMTQAATHTQQEFIKVSGAITGSVKALNDGLTSTMGLLDQIAKRLEDSTTKFAKTPQQLDKESLKSSYRARTREQQTPLASAGQNYLNWQNSVKGIDSVTQLANRVDSFFGALNTHIKGQGKFKSTEQAAQILTNVSSIEKTFITGYMGEMGNAFKKLNTGGNSIVNQGRKLMADRLREMQASGNKRMEAFANYALTGTDQNPRALMDNMAKLGQGLFKKFSPGTSAAEAFDTKKYGSHLRSLVTRFSRDAERSIDERYQLITGKLKIKASIETGADGTQKIVMDKKSLSDRIGKDVANHVRQQYVSVAQTYAKGMVTEEKISAEHTELQPAGGALERLKAGFRKLFHLPDTFGTKLAKVAEHSQSRMMTALDTLGYRMITISYMISKWNQLIDNAINVANNAYNTRATGLARSQPMYRGASGQQLTFADSMSQSKSDEGMLNDFVRRTGRSFDDMARSLYDASNAFPYVKDKAELLNISSQLATIGFNNVEKGLESMVAVMKTYNRDIETEQGAFDNAIRKIGHMATTAVQLGVLEMEDLAQAMQSMAPPASMLGVTMEELFSAFSVTAGVIGDASKTANRLNQLYMSIAMPSNQKLRDYYADNQTSGYKMIEEHGLLETVRKINDASQGDLRSMLGRKEGTIAAQALLNATDAYQKALAEVSTASTSMSDAFTKARFGVAYWANEYKIAEEERGRINAKFGEATVATRLALIQMGNAAKEFVLSIGDGFVADLAVVGSVILKVIGPVFAFIGGLSLAIRALTSFTVSMANASLQYQAQKAGVVIDQIKEVFLGTGLKSKMVASVVGGGNPLYTSAALTAKGLMTFAGVVGVAAVAIAGLTALVIRHNRQVKEQNVQGVKNFRSNNNALYVNNEIAKLSTFQNTIKDPASSAGEVAGARNLHASFISKHTKDLEMIQSMKTKAAELDKFLESLVALRRMQPTPGSTPHRDVNAIGDPVLIPAKAVAEYLEKHGGFSAEITKRLSDRSLIVAGPAGGQHVAGPGGAVTKTGLEVSASRTGSFSQIKYTTGDVLEAAVMHLQKLGLTASQTDHIYAQLSASAVSGENFADALLDIEEAIKNILMAAYEFDGKSAPDVLIDAMGDLSTSFRSTIEDNLTKYDLAKQDHNLVQMFPINETLNSAWESYVSASVSKLNSLLAEGQIDRAQRIVALAKLDAEGQSIIRAAKNTFVSPQHRDNVSERMSVFAAAASHMEVYKDNIEKGSKAQSLLNNVMLERGDAQATLGKLEELAMQYALGRYKQEGPKHAAQMEELEELIRKMRGSALIEAFENGGRNLSKAIAGLVAALNDETEKYKWKANEELKKTISPDMDFAQFLEASRGVNPNMQHPIIAGMRDKDSGANFSDLINNFEFLVSISRDTGEAIQTILAAGRDRSYEQGNELASAIAKNINSFKPETFDDYRTLMVRLGAYNIKGSKVANDHYPQPDLIRFGDTMELRIAAGALTEQFYPFQAAVDSFRKGVEDNKRQFMSPSKARAEGIRDQIKELKKHYDQNGEWSAEGMTKYGLSSEEMFKFQKQLENQAFYAQSMAPLDNHNAALSKLQSGEVDFRANNPQMAEAIGGVISNVGEGLGLDMSGLDLGALTGVLDSVSGGMFALLTPLLELQSVMLVINGPMAWFGVIIKVATEMLKPFIDAALGPLIGILVIMGQLLGAFLVPIIQMLVPIIQAIVVLFVVLYNVLLPVLNAFMLVIVWISNVVWNLGVAIGKVIVGFNDFLVSINRRLGFLDSGTAHNLRSAGYKDWRNPSTALTNSGMRLQPITVDQVAVAGNDYLAGGSGSSGGGSSADATRQPDQYFNFYIGADMITDVDGGKVVSLEYILDVFETRMAERSAVSA